jgi:hypothetical protein
VFFGPGKVETRTVKEDVYSEIGIGWSKTRRRVGFYFEEGEIAPNIKGDFFGRTVERF